VVAHVAQLETVQCMATPYTDLSNDPSRGHLDVGDPRLKRALRRDPERTPSLLVNTLTNELFDLIVESGNLGSLGDGQGMATTWEVVDKTFDAGSIRSAMFGIVAGLVVNEASGLPTSEQLQMLGHEIAEWASVLGPIDSELTTGVLEVVFGDDEFAAVIPEGMAIAVLLICLAGLLNRCRNQPEILSFIRSSLVD
jgi:hypothetical protein